MDKKLKILEIALQLKDKCKTVREFTDLVKWIERFIDITGEPSVIGKSAGIPAA